MVGGVGFFQAEDGIRDVERSRGLGDVYKRQVCNNLLQSVARMATLCNNNFFGYLASPFGLHFVTNCYISCCKWQQYVASVQDVKAFIF